MEKWITRSAAALVAAGSLALFWTFGVFVAVPWRESRMLSLNAVELQVLGIPLVAGILVAWGALHLLAIADRADSPRLYPAWRGALLIAALLATYGGASWTDKRASALPAPPATSAGQETSGPR
ncbi:MAG: hypothetical protein V5B32_08760 [Candidatus Accumulibacter sp. UW26]|jgi:hypothetical protein